MTKRKRSVVICHTLGTLGSVASLLAATLYQGNPDRNHKLWHIGSTVRYLLHMHVVLEYCYNVYVNGKFTMGTFKSTLLS
jgi:hypothetical protein